MLEASEALREGRDVAMDARYVSAAAPSNVLVARAEREKGEQGDERADERSWHRRQNEREHVPLNFALLVSTVSRSHERLSSLSSPPRQLRRTRRNPLTDHLPALRARGPAGMFHFRRREASVVGLRPSTAVAPSRP